MDKRKEEIKKRGLTFNGKDAVHEHAELSSV